MAKFLTIGYGDQAGYDGTPRELRDAAHAQDAALVTRGAVMGMAGTPIQVRNHQADGVRTESGAYLRSELPVAGFAVIEARDAHEAIRMVATTPCAIAYGVVEVWPLIEPPTT